MTPQADWVKELRETPMIDHDLYFGCYQGNDIGGEQHIRNHEQAIEDLVKFISKVELLAQQRTEKKWREKCENLKNKPFKIWLEYEVKLQNQLRQKGAPEITEKDIRWIQEDADRDQRNKGYNQALSDLLK